MAEPATDIHYSSCAVHNMPAYPAGPCDCGLEDRLRARIDAERDARERAEARVKVLEDALRGLLDGCVALDREQSILPRQMSIADAALKKPSNG